MRDPLVSIPATSTAATSTPASSRPGRAQVLGYCFLCLVWGSTWLAIRVVVRDVPPLEAAALRFLAAAAILFSSVFFRKAKWPAEKRQWNALLILGFTIMAIPYGLLFWAEQYISSSMTAVLFAALPLAVALLTPIMTGHKVPRRAVFAMVIAFGGLLLLFYTGLGMTGRNFLGGLAVLAAMSSSAWSVVFAKNRLHELDPVIATGLQLAIGSIALFWGTWALEPHRHAVWSRPAILGLMFLASFGSAGAFVVYYWLLKHLQPYQLSTSSLVVPVIAVLEGSLILREPVPPVMIAAIAAVLGSVATALRADAQDEARESLGLSNL